MSSIEFNVLPSGIINRKMYKEYAVEIVQRGILCLMVEIVQPSGLQSTKSTVFVIYQKLTISIISKNNIAILELNCRDKFRH